MAKAVRKPRRAKKPVVSHEELLAIQIRMSKVPLPVPLRQYRFATSMGREFRADFAWPEHRLLLECQGGVWRRGGGAHSHPTRLLDDIEKAQHAALLGYLVLPVTTDEVNNGRALRVLTNVLSNLGAIA